MMISLNRVGKRFNDNWIFKGVNFKFDDQGIYAILGQNGSGKSTLMRIVGGFQNATTGKLIYTINNKAIAGDKLYREIAYCAPGLEVIEEMNLKEFLQFHFSFKKIINGYTVDKIIDFLNFRTMQSRFIHDFSSGMKQRVKLVQAFFADTPILLLDEPCSNLDEAGVETYQNMLVDLTKDRLVIIASNDEREYTGAQQFLKVADFKPKATL